jgi:hypothetical protein
MMVSWPGQKSVVKITYAPCQAYPCPSYLFGRSTTSEQDRSVPLTNAAEMKKITVMLSAWFTGGSR